MIPVRPKISVTPIPIRMMTLATERLFTSSWTNTSIAERPFPGAARKPRADGGRLPDELYDGVMPERSSETARRVGLVAAIGATAGPLLPIVRTAAQPPGSPAGGVSGGCSTAHLN